MTWTKLLITRTKQFEKDYKKARSQKHDIEKLKVVISLLASKNQLPREYEDHPLKGSFKGYRDCHIENDWVLIYKVTDTELILYRVGSHSELFE